MDDPTTSGVTEGFGLMFYNARWYDPYLNRFTQPDSIVPLASQGTQAWDRYAYANNNPLRYNDPSGHCILCWAATVIGGVILGTTIYSNFIHEPSAPVDANASNIGDLMLLRYEHADHANIVGEGLQSLQDDPSVQDAQKRIVAQIKNLPEYGEEDFNVSASNKFSTTFTANGPSRNFAVGALTGNPAFYMVHTGTLYATNTTVSADGTISTTWKVDDKFDYIPDWSNHDRAHYWEYNIHATVVHFFYNTLGAAEEQYPTNAYWDDTIPYHDDDYRQR